MWGRKSFPTNKHMKTKSSIKRSNFNFFFPFLVNMDFFFEDFFFARMVMSSCKYSLRINMLRNCNKIPEKKMLNINILKSKHNIDHQHHAAAIIGNSTSKWWSWCGWNNLNCHILNINLYICIWHVQIQLSFYPNKSRYQKFMVYESTRIHTFSWPWISTNNIK